MPLFFACLRVYEPLSAFVLLFQAEDGIRDHCVTGVQTCALPILRCGDGAEPLERARALLVLGQVRRRAKQRGAAREALDAARALFEEIGAPLWAERARAELRRVGGRRASPDELTPSERRIAELVVTVHTVEKALTRAYRKLGVRSRTELTRSLAELWISPGKE